MVKITILLQMIYRFNEIFIITIVFFAGIEKLIIKFIQNHKGLRIAKTILQKNKFEELILPCFKTYYKVQ